MLIIENLEIEIALPIYLVENFVIKTVPNMHTVCNIKGVLEKNPGETILTDKKDMYIHIKYKGNIVFRGFVEEISIHSSADVHYFELKAYSYSKKLDNKEHTELFQNIEKTYGDLACDVVRRYSGNISNYNIKDKEIKGPVLCYKESAWAFAVRMASCIKTFIYPSMEYDKPHVHMGIHTGNMIEPGGIISESRDLIRKNEDTSRIEYRLRTYNSYDIGDNIALDNKILTLYKKEVEFTKGELIFNYQGVGRSCIEDMIYPLENENMIGLSLMGKIKRYKDGKVYLRLDIDKKEPEYGFDWYPETGNVLYAVPDKGEKAQLYIAGMDTGDMYVVRTFGSKGSDENKKQLEVGKKSLNFSKEGISFISDDILTVNDRRFKLTGNGDVNISAADKLTIKARNIRLNSKEEIVYISK
nr:hypothetical protein [uncultured Lachnoanaerobaculum sp.]